MSQVTLSCLSLLCRWRASWRPDYGTRYLCGHSRRSDHPRQSSILLIPEASQREYVRHPHPQTLTLNEEKLKTFLQEEKTLKTEYINTAMTVQTARKTFCVCVCVCLYIIFHNFFIIINKIIQQNHPDLKQSRNDSLCQQLTVNRVLWLWGQTRKCLWKSEVKRERERKNRKQ